MPEAIETLRSSKNLRIIEVKLGAPSQYEICSTELGLLIQERDLSLSKISDARLASDRKPTERELLDLELAWLITKHVKSNAIVIARDGLLIGIGAGQMSRVDSVEVALHKAKTHKHILQGAVAASDAFFPFPDSVEILAADGIRAIVAPNGAKRDDEIVAAARSKDISLLFAADRHFRH